MTWHQFDAFADYFQFYLQDDGMQLGDLSEVWTPAAVDRLIAVAAGAVGVHTVARTIHFPGGADDVIRPEADAGTEKHGWSL